MIAETSMDAYPSSLEHRSTDEWREIYESVFAPNYGRRRLALVRGRGSRVWDAEGREYLDFLTGISVNNLGHCHPKITAAIQEQAETLVHCTNLYYIPAQIEYGRLLIENCFADRLFLCNSGAEANEAAIKIARRWTRENRGPNINHVICMRRSFHGRTIMTLSATGQDKVWKDFYPLARGFYFAEFNDLATVERLMNKHTCAVLVEPVRGEGGFLEADPDFLTGLRRLCSERGILLIFDEIQCGLGRTGKLFAYEHYGLEPDIMTLAKSLGGGLAMGAMVTSEKIATAFPPGAHGTTMGGNALTCAAAHAYLKELIEGGHVERSAESGAYLRGKLRGGLEGCSNFEALRGFGLMVGIDVKSEGPEVVEACEEKGLLLNSPCKNRLRLLPALNVAREDIDAALAILIPAIKEAAF